MAWAAKRNSVERKKNRKNKNGINLRSPTESDGPHFAGRDDLNDSEVGGELNVKLTNTQCRLLEPEKCSQRKGIQLRLWYNWLVRARVKKTNLGPTEERYGMWEIQPEESFYI